MTIKTKESRHRLVRPRTPGFHPGNRGSNPRGGIMKQQKALLHWQAPEFVKYEKTILWDIGILVIAALFAIWGLWKGDITIIALAVLAGGLLWYFGKKEPRDLSFDIRTDGIQVGELIYRYGNFASFWIFHDPPHINELVLRNKKNVAPLVHINLGDQDPEKVKKALKGLLKEKEESYPLSHIFAHIIGY
jgi:hypothetical protein